MDRWMDGRRDDRMTGWQNRLKDTLQYSVTAQQTHRGLRESVGRRKKGERRQGDESWRSRRSNICEFFFSFLIVASVMWSVMGGETVTNIELKKGTNLN